MTGDRLELRELRVVAPVGLLEAERVAPQPVRIDIDVELDLAVPGGSDDERHMVSYATVAEIAAAIATSHHHDLLESLVTEIAEATLALDGSIEAVVVTVTKLRPPIPLDIGTVGVRRRLERR
jgi:dihydroneopterin aldolase